MTDWYVLNARDAQWSVNELGWYSNFERAERFPEFGINLNVLPPGKPMAMYHHEPYQEGFLVRDGDAVLIIDGQERPLRKWDHVHRLHPYHGKFIPQLVEVLLDRYFTRGARVLDPFAGSGTTLVQALESGCNATGVEVAAFNCLLVSVKTARYDLAALGAELHDASARLDSLSKRRRAASAYLRAWYAPQALAELLAFRDLIEEYDHRDVLRVVLSRAARS